MQETLCLFLDYMQHLKIAEVDCDYFSNDQHPITTVIKSQEENIERKKLARYFE